MLVEVYYSQDAPRANIAIEASWKEEYTSTVLEARLLPGKCSLEPENLRLDTVEQNTEQRLVLGK